MIPIKEYMSTNDIQYLDYSEMVASMGYAVLIWESDNDYQGDTYAVVQDAQQHKGFLIFGWGSCSGCDALEAAEDDLEALETLRNNLDTSIQWFDSDESLFTFMREHDWEGDYCYLASGFKSFKEAMNKYANTELFVRR